MSRDTERLRWRWSGPDSDAPHWALQGREGSLESAPGPAPCDLVLAAGLTRFARIALPVGVRSADGSLLGFALEDGLINAPDDNRFLALGQRDGQWAVALTSAGLGELLARLRQHGFPVVRIVPEELLLPLPPVDTWCVAAVDRGWMVRRSAHDAVTLPYAAEPLAAGLAAPTPPAAGLLLCGDGHLPDAWQQWPVHRGAPYDWRHAPLPAGAGFARDDWAPRLRAGHWPALGRHAAVLLAALLGLDLAVGLGELGWLALRTAAVERQMVADARASGVTADSGNDALFRLQAQLDRQRLLHAAPRSDGLFGLMAALDQVADPTPLSLSALDYRAGQLRFHADGLERAQTARWQPMLAALQLQLDRGGDGLWRLARASPQRGTR